MSAVKIASKFLKHIPCEACGSSDGNSLYDDEHTYCHVCQTYDNGGTYQEVHTKPSKESKPMTSRG